MIITDLDKMLREFTDMEQNWYDIYRENVPPNDAESERRYIEQIDKNRPALNTPQLYYNSWNEEDIINFETFEEFKKERLRKKDCFPSTPKKKELKSGLISKSTVGLQVCTITPTHLSK